jgi:hypothetical protein
MTRVKSLLSYASVLSRYRRPDDCRSVRFMRREGDEFCAQRASFRTADPQNYFAGFLVLGCPVYFQLFLIRVVKM